MSVFNDDEPDWPNNDSLGKRMTGFEECLRCPLCKELLENATELTTCGHIFCALCIAKHFDQKLNANTSDACPVCRVKCTLKTSKSARIIKELVSKYSSVRSDLIQAATSNSKGSHSLSAEAQGGKSALRPQTQHLHAPHFHGLTKVKVKQMLAALCKDAKSSSAVEYLLSGEKDVLERRYREIVLQNNAQIGSLTPLSFDQIVVNVKNSEVARAEGSRHATSTTKERILRGQANNAQFMELVRAARASKASTAEGTEESKLAPVEDYEDEEQPVWRVVWSEKLGRPFFFNTISNIGQFAVPPELAGVDYTGGGVAPRDGVSSSVPPASSPAPIDYSMGTNTQFSEGLDGDIMESEKKRKWESPADDDGDDVEIVETTAAATTVSGWACETCTFWNTDESLSNCEMCSVRSNRTTIVRRSQSSAPRPRSLFDSSSRPSSQVVPRPAAGSKKTTASQKSSKAKNK